MVSLLAKVKKVGDYENGHSYPHDVGALDEKSANLGELEKYNESLIYSTKALAIDPNDESALSNKVRL